MTENEKIELTANPVPALRKQLRESYSADLFSSLVQLKRIFFLVMRAPERKEK